MFNFICLLEIALLAFSEDAWAQRRCTWDGGLWWHQQDEATSGVKQHWNQFVSTCCTTVCALHLMHRLKDSIVQILHL